MSNKGDNISSFKSAKWQGKISESKLGVVVFVIVFIYVVTCVVVYLQKDHISRYEVKEGSLAVNSTYRGIIFRDEEVVSAATAGYVNYLAGEGERVASGNMVYMVDETGDLMNKINSNGSASNSLTERELGDFRNDIINYMHSYDHESYNTVYDFKNTLTGSLNKIAYNNIYKAINAMNEGGTSNIYVSYAPFTGMVSYWIDGFENLKPSSVTANLYNEENYSKTYFAPNSLVANGDPVYKLCDNEDWMVVIQCDEDMAAELLTKEYVKVRFLKNQYESWGEVSVFVGTDGASYVGLKFNNSMVTFLSDRFIDVEIILNDEKGLKIPNSSIVEKDFYLVPEEYIMYEGAENPGVLKQMYKDDGQPYTAFSALSVYSFDKETREYYFDTDILSSGDILYKADSIEPYVVGRKATLIGVYNINKGYADFKEIEVLYSNDEYSIVQANTKYGLSVYDYIVLDAEAVTVDQFINK